MCFFGHKFGKVEADGFQYCSKCGAAKKPAIPHPCANGHQWEDEAKQRYRTTEYGYYGGTSETISIQTFQHCKVCGVKRTVTV